MIWCDGHVLSENGHWWEMERRIRTQNLECQISACLLFFPFVERAKRGMHQSHSKFTLMSLMVMIMILYYKWHFILCPTETHSYVNQQERGNTSVLKNDLVHHIRRRKIKLGELRECELWCGMVYHIMSSWMKWLTVGMENHHHCQVSFHFFFAAMPGSLEDHDDIGLLGHNAFDMQTHLQRTFIYARWYWRRQWWLRWYIPKYGLWV